MSPATSSSVEPLASEGKTPDEADTATPAQEGTADNAKDDIEELFVTTKKAGHTAFQDGRYPEAHTLYTKAIALKPRDPGLYSNRSGVLFLQGKFREAEKDAIICLQLDPLMQVARGYVRLGSALLAQQKNEAAARILRKGLALAPQAKDPEVGKELQIFLDQIPPLAHTRDHEIVIGEDDAWDEEAEDVIGQFGPFEFEPLLDESLKDHLREIQQSSENHASGKPSGEAVTSSSTVRMVQQEPVRAMGGFSCFACWNLAPCHTAVMPPEDARQDVKISRVGTESSSAIVLSQSEARMMEQTQ
eukprot:gnl/MRDRNA2_/MRDRNA2_107982_c0_seq1.p1 gnl/MRDRNA2_/MRDRNA2_107982_c0~~gnl/MRDRNA2_/MRDRNA2_107982_c0_seq1.p1  ORF type:complete len:303 (+),score=66.27 gnl/MRDRNA2_/MRDRNA2_107982_c0_seq1:103-1011(+)